MPLTVNTAELFSEYVKSAGVLTVNSPIAESISLNFSVSVKFSAGIVGKSSSSILVPSALYQPS